MDFLPTQVDPSSPRASNWSYDVFLSFRGEDTRSNFTSHLYTALRHKGVNVFLDEAELPRGEEISASLLKAIEDSRILIIIFSENYAFSTWCLDELVKIIECKKKSRAQMICPVFYMVNPSDVRKQTGSFGRALAEHEYKFFFQTEVKFINNMKKIQTWREALTAAANLSGWDLGTEKEASLVSRIVEAVLSKLNRTALHVAKNPVGIDSQVQDMIVHLNLMSDCVRMIGILGIGGIGKTTLAKALYNEIADQFEGCSFLADVSATANQFDGLVRLQETLLYEIFGDSLKVGSHHRGINIIRNRLCSKRILLILDDVDKLEQLEALAGRHDWFGQQSRIIVTTRDRHLLVSHGFDQLYVVNGLNHDEALELFSWNAFKKKSPTDNLFSLSKQVISYSRYLPLALVVLGSFLYTKSKSEWESALASLEKTPNKEVQEILKISFRKLDDNGKSIFLYISCFFVGEDKDEVIRILEACDFEPDIGLRVLIDMSLISIKSSRIEMHDLIRQMGQEIIRQESSEPGNRSILWLQEEVLDVFSEGTGTNAVEAMKLDVQEPKKLNINATTFINMKRLRLLIIKNAMFSRSLEHLPKALRWVDWFGFKSSSLPPNFPPKKIVGLKMEHGFIKQLGKGFKNMESLKYVNLSYSKFLEKIPDFSTVPNLEEFVLIECENLTEIHESVGSLGKLVILNLEKCSNLKKLPSSLKLKSLQVLNLALCRRLEQFPQIIGNMESLRLINLESTAVEELPSSFKSLIGLHNLDLRHCKNLKALPSTILLLRSLKNLYLGGCSSLGRFPKIGELEMEPTECSVASVIVETSSTSAFLHPPVPNENLCSSLSLLELEDCNLSNADFLETYSTIFSALSILDLSGNRFSSLPPCISELTSLRTLYLRDCELLQKIPKLPRQIKHVDASGCKALIQIPDNIADVLSSNKEIKDYHPIDVILMNGTIPEWYSYRNMTGSRNNNVNYPLSFVNSVSFDLPYDSYANLIALAPCINFKVVADKWIDVYCKVLLDSKSITFSERFYPSTSEYMWLHAFPISSTDRLRNNLYHVNVSFGTRGAFRSSDFTIRGCGVHLVGDFCKCWKYTIKSIHRCQPSRTYICY